MTECTLSIAKFISKSTDLIHLDLSYNGFTQEEAEEISKSLNQNQSIYGFHFEGNCDSYVVDKFGFLSTVQPLPIEIVKLDGLKLKNVNVNFLNDDILKKGRLDKRVH